MGKYLNSDLVLGVGLPLVLLILLLYLYIYVIKNRIANLYILRSIQLFSLTFFGILCIGVSESINEGIFELGDNIKEILRYVGFPLFILSFGGLILLNKDRIVDFYRSSLGKKFLKKIIIWFIIMLIVVFFILMLEGEL